MNKLAKVEQETIIIFNEQDKTDSVSTYNAVLVRKLEKLCRERPDECRKNERQNGVDEYIVPKKWIKVNPPRQMSAEAKAKAAERLNNLRNQSQHE